MKQNKTNEGSRTWQTLLTVTAFRRPASDDEEEEEEEDEEEAMSISSKRKAAAIGVTKKTWCYAVKRMKQLRADLHPTEAIKNGIYYFWPRIERSDAASEELVQLMGQYVCSSPQKTRGKKTNRGFVRVDLIEPQNLTIVIFFQQLLKLYIDRRLSSNNCRK